MIQNVGMPLFSNVTGQKQQAQFVPVTNPVSAPKVQTPKLKQLVSDCLSRCSKDPQFSKEQLKEAYNTLKTTGSVII